MSTEQVKIERRLHTRHRARTRVHIRPDGKKHQPKMCHAINLSANGVGVVTEGMSLPLGMICELSFAIDLKPVVKIHKRFGRVIHIRNGVTGFAMEAFGAKVVDFKP